MNVTVVGCGVSGLTTAVMLRRRGHDAHVVAEAMPHECVSAVAGAIWGPTTVEPAERTGPWALVSRAVFAELSQQPDTGVAPMVHLDLRADDTPHWGETTPWVRRASAAELPPGYASGLVIDGFRVDPPIYLDWLLAEFDRLGGRIELRRIETLATVTGDALVNCTGLGARDLVGDDSMYPIRGQMVLVPGGDISNGISDELDQNRISYVYPRSRHMYLGGARDVDDNRETPVEALTQRILDDAAILEPRVAGRPVREVRVGFRPGRPRVRLEVEEMDDGRSLVHNYGHGGAGFIMSWGCATEVADLLDLLN